MHDNNQTMHVSVNNTFIVVYNSKFHKSTKLSCQSKLVTCCSQCSGIIFIIALALWISDHAFIMQKLLQYFEGRVTHITKTNRTEVLDI